MKTNVRHYTNKLLEMVENGLVDKDSLIRSFACYLSESDVHDLMHREGLLDDEDEESEEEEEEEEDSQE